jgi:enamine deaminase RidA (YjgF/YER057c/UK114 family)
MRPQTGAVGPDPSVLVDAALTAQVRAAAARFDACVSTIAVRVV